jgi:hypothetical protein
VFRSDDKYGTLLLSNVSDVSLVADSLLMKSLSEELPNRDVVGDVVDVAAFELCHRAIKLLCDAANRRALDNARIIVFV